MKQKENIFEELNKMKSLIKAKPGTVISEQEIQEIGFGAYAAYQQQQQQKTPSGYNLSGTQTVTERQKNINGNYCSVKNGVIVTGGYSNGTKWDDYVKTYSVTADELATAKASCGNKGGSGGNNRANDYSRIVGDYSKKFQTEIGSSPTGQISDADLQKALSQLNGEISGEVGQLDQNLPKTADGQIDLAKALEILEK